MVSALQGRRPLQLDVSSFGRADAEGHHGSPPKPLVKRKPVRKLQKYSGSALPTQLDLNTLIITCTYSVGVALDTRCWLCLADESWIREEVEVQANTFSWVILTFESGEMAPAVVFCFLLRIGDLVASSAVSQCLPQ